MGEVEEGRKISGLRSVLAMELEEMEGFGDALLVVTAEVVCEDVFSTIIVCFLPLFS